MIRPLDNGAAWVLKSLQHSIPSKVPCLLQATSGGFRLASAGHSDSGDAGWGSRAAARGAGSAMAEAVLALLSQGAAFRQAGSRSRTPRPQAGLFERPARRQARRLSSTFSQSGAGGGTEEAKEPPRLDGGRKGEQPLGESNSPRDLDGQLRRSDQEPTARCALTAPAPRVSPQCVPGEYGRLLACRQAQIRLTYC